MLPTPMRPTRAFRWLLAALAFLVLLFLTMAMTARPREVTSTLENIVATVLHPFQAATGWVVGQVNGAVAWVEEVGTLRAENERLRVEVAELRRYRVLNEILAKENLEMRQELALRTEYPYSFLAAEVLQRDSSNWFQDVVINRGSRDGVRTGMAVVNHEGLVGTVARVTLTTSTVRLLTDPEFAISAMTVPAGEIGPVQRRDGQLLVEFPHNPEAPVKPGDTIVTSGLGEHVPANLIIGTVASVGMRENNLIKYGVLRPGVDFERLRFVQVVLTGAAEGGAAP